jgi:hypothetical protein
MLQLFSPNWHRSTLFWHNSQLKFQTFLFSRSSSYDYSEKEREFDTRHEEKRKQNG